MQGMLLAWQKGAAVVEQLSQLLFILVRPMPPVLRSSAAIASVALHSAMVEQLSQLLLAPVAAVRVRTSTALALRQRSRLLQRVIALR